MRGGEVVEDGDFALDGVAFPGAEIVLEFLAPAGGAGGLFPSGRVAETLDVPGLGAVAATLIDAMQTREQLYDSIGYHAYERRLDALYGADAAGDAAPPEDGA
jgi:2-methylaconitate cis-trans-isomerase PrpF